MKELIHQYGAWIVFALVFLESIGLPLPGEAILVSAAIFAGTTQELGIALVLLSAVLGAIVGSTIGFWIGDRYGYPLLLRYGSYIGLTETRIKIAQYLFRRQGMVVVLIARFVAVLRSVVGFIAGANRMPFANFMLANSAGAVAWALFYGLGAYYLAENPGCAAPSLERATKRPHSLQSALQKALAIGGGWSGTAVNSGRPERSEILPRRLQRPRWGFGSAAAEPPLTEWRIPMSKSAKKRTAAATSATAATKTAQQSQAQTGGVVLQAIACHCNASIASGCHDRRDNEGHGLAAALGAGLSGWSGAQAS